MKVFLVFSVLALFSFIVIPTYADVTIIEVESNPEGEDAGSEWAMLFNSGTKRVSLSGWGISSSLESHDLSGRINPCSEKMVYFDGEFLDNLSDSLILYDLHGLVVSSTGEISDEKDNSSTWKTKPPVCESEKEQVSQETLPEEPVAQPVRNETISADEKDKGFDFGISIEQNENFDTDFMEIMPYLGIVVIGIVGGLAAIIVKNRQKKDDDEPQEKDRSIIESISLSKKFQDMQVDSPKNIDVKFDKIILEKLQKIKILQENKFGDREKLESIKNNLEQVGHFTKKESDYVELQYEEYTKQKDSE